MADANSVPAQPSDNGSQSRQDATWQRCSACAQEVWHRGPWCLLYDQRGRSCAFAIAAAAAQLELDL